MKKKEYLDSSQGYPIVRFPRVVISSHFEQILNECYKATLLKKNTKVNFDFSNVTWCDIFELSLLSLWILELKSKSKEIIFQFPTNRDVCNFLANYKFEVFLDNNKIEKENIGVVKTSPKPTDLKNVPYYPLTFLSEESFKNILADLYYGNRLEIILNDIKDTEIVKSGAIRDIVLKEIGDNVFRHGQGQFAHIIMTKFEAESPEKARLWAESILNRVSELEKPFFRKLYGKPFLALVISDKGDGIHNSLVNSYSCDDIIHNKKDKPVENDILEYAFLYHTTRRSIEERIGEIKDVISKEAMDFPPPTGLHRLIEVVREFHGFLYLRSGSSIICYDFYNNQKNGKPIFNKSIKALNKLTNFGGTQYKIYFPIDVPSHKSTAQSFFFSEKTDKPLEYNYLSLKSYFSLETLNNFDKEAAKLHALFNEIERNRCSNGSILIDFGNGNEKNISSKAIHYLLFEMMQRQTQTSANVGINLNYNIINQFKKIFEIKKHFFMKPLILFDEKFTPNVIGVDLDKVEIFNKLRHVQEPQAPEMQSFASKNSHLFFYNSSTNNYQFIHPPLKIIQTVRNSIRGKMEEMILDPKSNIFDGDIRVLIPSGLYCKGYFEAYKIIGNDDWGKNILTWFKYWIIELRPDFVISISGYIGGIVDSAVSELKSLYSTNIKHINFNTPIRESDPIKLIFELENGKKGVIFTDVIGTGRTIESILEKAQHTAVVKIFTLINALTDGENGIELKGKTFNIESLAKKELAYHNSLPKGWLYSEVHEVDPDTHILVKKAAKAEGPLWKEIKSHQDTENGEIFERQVNDFFEDIVIPTDSVIEGHFTAGDKHMIYLFNIPNILKHYLEVISEKIVGDVKEEFAKIKGPKEVTHIFYPEFNPGLDQLANRISAKFSKSTPVPIKYSEFRSSFDQEEPIKEIDVAIIIDDAFVSGDTIFRMFDICERKGARHIFTYVLIKRGTEYLARRLEKVSQYGHLSVQTRYLVDAEIPTYTSTDCPICKQIEELSAIMKKVEEIPSLKEFINEEIDKLSPYPVSVSIEEGLLTSSESYSCKRGTRLNLRWKLELSKKLPGQRKELATIVGEYKAVSGNALPFFQVLAQEKHIFLLDEKNKKLIFYESFAANIIKACRYFCGQIENLVDEEIEAILSILKVFDEDFFIDNLLELLQKTICDRKKFLKIIVQSLLLNKSYEYPTRIKNTLEKLKVAVTNEDLNKTIDHLILYWSEQEKEEKNHRSKKLAYYKDLTGGIFHEIGHLKDNIIYYVDEKPMDIEKIILYWNSFSEKIKEALIKLRIFSGSNLSSDLTSKLSDKIISLDFQTNECNNLILEIKNTENFSYSTDIVESITCQIKQIVLRINNLIYNGKCGIIKLLENFKTNVKTVAHLVIQQTSEDLSSNNINIERDFPDDICLVFGEEDAIATVFQNLIDNVWKHTTANLLKIIVIIREENKEIDILFLDNGQGLSDGFEYGYGLKIVDDTIASLCGKFKITRLAGNSEYYKSGFKTMALVTIPHIREVKQ